MLETWPTFHKAQLVKRDNGYDMNVNDIEKYFLKNFRNGPQENYWSIIGDVWWASTL